MNSSSGASAGGGWAAGGACPGGGPAGCAGACPGPGVCPRAVSPQRTAPRANQYLGALNSHASPRFLFSRFLCRGLGVRGLIRPGIEINIVLKHVHRISGTLIARGDNVQILELRLSIGGRQLAVLAERTPEPQCDAEH